MASFPERMGLKNPREVLQTDSLDSETRVRIWNYVAQLREMFGPDYANNTDFQLDIAVGLWASHLHRPIDEFNSASELWQVMKAAVLKGEWSDALWFIEVFVDAVRRVRDNDLAMLIANEFNGIFESALVGFRFVAGELVRVTEKGEVLAIESALAATAGFAGAHKLLQNSLSLLASRDSSKYAKSVAESISAVEAIVRHLTAAQTLGDGLKTLEAKGHPIHPALKDGWLKIYGYTSNENGIRHGSVIDSEIDEPLATYFLVSCSAFINLLLKESVKKIQST